MHVVKKSVAAKLTAMKIEPPRPPSPYLVPGATPLSDAESELRGAVTVKHRASRSYASQDTPIRGNASDVEWSYTESYVEVLSPKTRVGARRAEPINTLFPIAISHDE
jgi:hypothetical protein